MGSFHLAIMKKEPEAVPDESPNARVSIAPRIRFEVFKRDGFKCQYCGAAAPEAILEVDHVHPVSKGGGNELLNLITSCKTCNSGKSNIELSDDAAIQKQRLMLDELSERREQMEMMIRWREGLKSIDEDALNHACDSWADCTEGWTANESGRKEMAKLIRKFSLPKVLDAIEAATSQYLRYDSDGMLTPESVQLAWSKIGGCARGANMDEDERALFYIRGICKNRFDYCNPATCLVILKEAYGAGVDVEEMKEIAKQARSWTEWRRLMSSLREV